MSYDARVSENSRMRQDPRVCQDARERPDSTMSQETRVRQWLDVKSMITYGQ